MLISEVGGGKSFIWDIRNGDIAVIGNRSEIKVMLLTENIQEVLIDERVAITEEEDGVGFFLCVSHKLYLFEESAMGIEPFGGSGVFFWEIDRFYIKLRSEKYKDTQYSCKAEHRKGEFLSIKPPERVLYKPAREVCQEVSRGNNKYILKKAETIGGIIMHISDEDNNNPMPKVDGIRKLTDMDNQLMG